MTTAPTKYLTAKEYAAMLRVHVKTVLRWVRQNEIPGAFRRPNGTVRIPQGAEPPCEGPNGESLYLNIALSG